MHIHFLKLVVIAQILFIGCEKSKSIAFIENPTGVNSSLPRLYTDNIGTVFMSWIEKENDTTKLFYSAYVNDSWSDKILINESNEWFVNWADFPSILGYDKKPMATHWLQKVPGNAYSYNVEVSTYDKEFSEPFVIHKDGTNTEHGFVSMTATSDTTFYATWLDGRNTAGGGHTEHSNLSTAMTIRGAELTIKGEFLSEEELDNSVCDCCNTAVAKTKRGLIVAYRNRTENEVRDIYIKKKKDGEWLASKPIHEDNWEIAACPVNGPAIAVNNNTVSVAWFTGAGGVGKVKLAFSSDAGDSFSTPIVLDSVSTLGRVDIVAKNEHSSWISWISRTKDSAQLNVQLRSVNGEIIEQHVVSAINPSRNSGFPQITAYKDSLLIAWTNKDQSDSRIETVIL